MARTKTSANPPPPSVNYKSQYPWAFDELLAETSTLTTIVDWRAHVGEPGVYKHDVFAKKHDAYISVHPCTPGEPVCVDDRSNNGEAFFFFFYQTVFKRIGLCLPLSGFERELLKEINVAPAQLHPNSWAFVKAFGILCGYLANPPPWTYSFTYSRSRSKGKASGSASAASPGGSFYLCSSNPTRDGGASSSGCAALITTAQCWMGSLYTRYKN